MTHVVVSCFEGAVLFWAWFEHGTSKIRRSHILMRQGQISRICRQHLLELNIWFRGSRDHLRKAFGMPTPPSALEESALAAAQPLDAQSSLGFDTPPLEEHAEDPWMLLGS